MVIDSKFSQGFYKTGDFFVKVPHLSITRNSAIMSEKAAMNKKLLLQHAARKSVESHQDEPTANKNPVA